MKIRNPIVARFQNEPSMIARDHQAWFESCVEGAHVEMNALRLKAEAKGESLESGDGDWWGEPGSFLSWLRPYVVKNGILQIPIKGVLLHDFPYAFGSHATGYDYIWRAFERGMGDLSVKGIALVVDSPGGMVAGCFDMVDKMYAMRGRKPIAGFASEHAYSAAYAAISVVDPGRLYVTQTGGVGSIGVVTSHVDVSGMMEQIGWKITFIFAGDHKVDGNPYEALPDEVKARIQTRIDKLYSIFVSTVARNRGIGEDAVRGTKALTFDADEALSNGLADKVGSLDDSLADFAADLNRDEGNETMSDYTKEQYEAAVAAARSEGVAEGKAAGLTEGATAEQARISGILACENAADRPAAALAAATDTQMSIEQANTFLGKLPVEEKAAAPSGEGAGKGQDRFDKAMGGQDDNPNVGDSDKKDGDGAEKPSKGRATMDAIKPRKAA